MAKLRYFYRIDQFNNPIPGTLEKYTKKPKTGKWGEITREDLDRKPCCVSEQLCTDFLVLTSLEEIPVSEYPTGVFNVNGDFLGTAANKQEYADLWNSDLANAAVGILSTTTDNFTFRISYLSVDCQPLDITLGAGEIVNFPLMNFNDDVVPSAPYGLFDGSEAFLGLADDGAEAAAIWNATPALFAIAAAVPVTGDDQSIDLVLKTADPLPEFRALRYWHIDATLATPSVYTGPNDFIRKANGTVVKANTGTLGNYTQFGLNASTYGVAGNIPLVDTGSVYYINTLTVGTNYIFHNEDSEWAWCDVFGRFANNGGNLPPAVRHLAIQSNPVNNTTANLRLSNFTNHATALSNVEAISYNGYSIQYDQTDMNLMPNLITWQLLSLNGQLIQLADLNLSAAVTPNLKWIGYRRNNSGVALTQNDAWWAALPELTKGIDFVGAQLEPAANVDGAFINLAISQAATVTEANARLTLQNQNALRTAASDAAVATLTARPYVIG